MPAANACMETKSRAESSQCHLAGAILRGHQLHPNKAQFCSEFLLNFQGQVLKDREEAGLGD